MELDADGDLDGGPGAEPRLQLFFKGPKSLVCVGNFQHKRWAWFLTPIGLACWGSLFNVPPLLRNDLSVSISPSHRPGIFCQGGGVLVGSYNSFISHLPGNKSFNLLVGLASLSIQFSKATATPSIYMCPTVSYHRHLLNVTAMRLLLFAMLVNVFSSATMKDSKEKDSKDPLPRAQALADGPPDQPYPLDGLGSSSVSISRVNLNPDVPQYGLNHGMYIQASNVNSQSFVAGNALFYIDLSKGRCVFRKDFGKTDRESRTEALDFINCENKDIIKMAYNELKLAFITSKGVAYCAECPDGTRYLCFKLEDIQPDPQLELSFSMDTGELSVIKNNKTVTKFSKDSASKAYRPTETFDLEVPKSQGTKGGYSESSSISAPYWTCQAVEKSHPSSNPELYVDHKEESPDRRLLMKVYRYQDDDDKKAEQATGPRAEIYNFISVCKLTEDGIEQQVLYTFEFVSASRILKCTFPSNRYLYFITDAGDSFNFFLEDSQVTWMHSRKTLHLSQCTINESILLDSGNYQKISLCLPDLSNSPCTDKCNEYCICDAEQKKAARKAEEKRLKEKSPEEGVLECKTKSNLPIRKSCFMDNTLIFVDPNNENSLYSQKLDQKQASKLIFYKGFKNVGIRHVACSAATLQPEASIAFTTVTNQLYYCKRREDDGLFDCKLIDKVMIDENTTLTLSKNIKMLAINTASCTTIWIDNFSFDFHRDLKRMTPEFWAFVASIVRPNFEIRLYSPNFIRRLKNLSKCYKWENDDSCLLPLAASSNGVLVVLLIYGYEDKEKVTNFGLKSIRTTLEIKSSEQERYVQTSEYPIDKGVSLLGWTLSPHNSLHWITSDGQLTHCYPSRNIMIKDAISMDMHHYFGAEGTHLVSVGSNGPIAKPLPMTLSESTETPGQCEVQRPGTLDFQQGETKGLSPVDTSGSPDGESSEGLVTGKPADPKLDSSLSRPGSDHFTEQGQEECSKHVEDRTGGSKGVCVTLPGAPLESDESSSGQGLLPKRSHRGSDAKQEDTLNDLGLPLVPLVNPMTTGLLVPVEEEDPCNPVLVTEFETDSLYAFTGKELLFAGHGDSEKKLVVLSHNPFHIQAKTRLPISRVRGLKCFSAYPGVRVFVVDNGRRVVIKGADDGELMLTVPMQYTDGSITNLEQRISDNNLLCITTRSHLSSYLSCELLLINLAAKSSAIITAVDDGQVMESANLNLAGTLLAYTSQSSYVNVLSIEHDEKGKLVPFKCLKIPGRASSVMCLKNDVLAIENYDKREQYAFYKIDVNEWKVVLLDGAFDAKGLDRIYYNAGMDTVVATVRGNLGEQRLYEFSQTRRFFKDTKILIINPWRIASCYLEPFMVSPDLTCTVSTKDGLTCSVHQIPKDKVLD